MQSRLSRQLLLALALSVAVFAGCAWPAFAWGGRSGLAALGLAGGICFLGAALARVATRAFRRLDPSDEAGPRSVQAGITVRMLLTLALSMPVFFLEPVAPLPFAVWLAANYMAQLVLEVFVSLRDLRQNHGPSPGGTPPAATDLCDRPSRHSPTPGADQE